MPTPTASSKFSPRSPPRTSSDPPQPRVRDRHRHSVSDIAEATRQPARHPPTAIRRRCDPSHSPVAMAVGCPLPGSSVAHLLCTRARTRPPATPPRRIGQTDLQRMSCPGALPRSRAANARALRSVGRHHPRRKTPTAGIIQQQPISPAGRCGSDCCGKRVAKPPCASWLTRIMALARLRRQPMQCRLISSGDTPEFCQSRPAICVNLRCNSTSLGSTERANDCCGALSWHSSGLSKIRIVSP
jgi:hypothetical protein